MWPHWPIAAAIVLAAAICAQSADTQGKHHSWTLLPCCRRRPEWQHLHVCMVGCMHMNAVIMDRACLLEAGANMGGRVLRMNAEMA